MRLLSEVYQYTEAAQNADEPDVELADLRSDSRSCGKGDVYVPMRGNRFDGFDFIKQAQDAGAAAVLAVSVYPTAQQLQGVTIPVLTLPASKKLADFACWFYRDPSKRLRLIGVTGTNGKSTTTWIIAQLLTALGHKCGVLGTLGNGFLPKLEHTTNTTLAALDLQRTLSHMCDEKAEYAAMEVSSIGICEGRIDGVTFAARAFTNLTRDHLDYHHTIENYYSAKKQLFLGKNAVCAVNIADPYGRRLSGELEDRSGMIAWSARSDAQAAAYGAYLQLSDISYEKDGLRFKAKTASEEETLSSALLGGFNAENLACALAVLVKLGFSLKQLAPLLPKVRPVTGRMERFQGEGKPALIVDYAHTPDGVEQVLRAAREHHPRGLVWVVLGCGGDRDTGKRPIMAIKASVFADRAVFTSDNPRSEDPDAILRDMASGVAQADNCVFITDRRKAIEYAFEHAAPEDCIVIAGKGHEDYQIFKDRTIHFADREIAAQLAGVKLDKF